MPQERIDDLNDPRLEVYRDIKTRNKVRDAKVLVAEGPTVVERLLNSDVKVHSVLVSDRKFASFEARLPAEATVFRVTDAQAETLIGFNFHAGVIACAERPQSELPEKLTARDEPALIVAGDRITDPENVGALIRIGRAFGVDAMLFGPGSADPFSRRVLRVSMGNVLFVPIVEPGSLLEALRELRDVYGFELCTAVLDPTAEPLSAVQFEKRSVLLFGNEYDGVSPELVELANRRVTIPMLNGTDSLNVAVSAGICLHQYRSQRGP